ncbi:MAG: sensor histidine kinase [Oceanipulchritudo sp.]
MDTPASLPRFHRVILILGLVTLAIYSVALATALLYFRAEVRGQILGRDGILLASVAQHFHDSMEQPVGEIDLLEVALESSGIRGVIGVRLYSANGDLIGRVPASLYAVRLPAEDLHRIRTREAPPIRHDPDYSMESLFSDQFDLEDSSRTPVTEVLAPVRDAGGEIAAIIQYWLDGREVAGELGQLDRSLLRLGLAFMAAGAAIFVLVFLYARQRLLNMGKILEERNRSLERANADLALAARTSAIGSVTSHLFHGLKNPLAGLKNYLRLTAGDQEAVALTERMQSLIDETLSVIREADSGRDFELSFAELMAMTRERFGNHSRSDLAIEGSGEGSVSARKTRLLFLILRNLVENAADASGPGQPVILRLRMADGTLTAEVEDNGPGLPEAIRERLFEPVKSRKVNGTGVGLAISAAIARHIPATLTLKQSSNEGTTFSIQMTV